MIYELNEQNFNETIKSGITLVDFWADNCNPCIEMFKVLEDFSNVADKSLKIGKLNWDSNISIVQNYRIMSAPTLMIFKDGQPVDQLVWVQTVEKLKEFTQKYI